MTANNKLTRQQKEAVGLLSIGTFLEYFDMMLYVHMAVLLNDLFFPKTDPTTAKLLAATAFCLTYLLRPVGGYIIGKIGDTLGRKFTITLTTFVMAFACVILATAKTYEEVGIRATIVIMLCRVLQGFSSLGEIMGAQIYITEIMKNPWRAVSSGVVVFAANLGGGFALVIALLALSGGNWRMAFWIGAIIALVGVFARTRLRETIEFTDYKRRMKRKNLDIEQYIEKPNKKTLLAFAFTEIHGPICFYVTYIFCGQIMKDSFGFTAEQVIYQNLKVTIVLLIGLFIVAILAKRIHPIKTAMVTSSIFIISLLFIPYCLNNISNLFILGCIQVLIKSFTFSTCGTLDAIQYKYFPIGKRFSSIAVTFGFSSAFSSVLIVFGLVPLYHYFGYYALWFLFGPIFIGYWWAINYFKKLEIKRGAYHNYPKEDFPEPDTAIEEEDFDYEDLEDEYKPFASRCEYSENLFKKLESVSNEMKKKLNMKLIKKAVIFAKRWHGDVMRKTGKDPFYSHPLKVAEMVGEKYPKTDVIVAAILHDVVEDSVCTVGMIEKKFNKRIAELVDRLTRKRTDVKLTVDEVVQILQDAGDNEALFIKGMDRMHNLETIEGLSPEKQMRMAKGSGVLNKLISIIADKLGVYDKIYLENKMLKHTHTILKKK
ncbi:MAG: MHS family proline/betaine transporter-like MFS transporter [Candidatus Midichloriaceae bacterium]|jgi:MHS family proline/betaine transporter-like MFS transporter